MSLLTQASLVLTPNAVKASKLYSIIPSNGNGDMTVVRATTATRVNSSGLIESVATNVPRLNYDGSCPSVLVEPQRTNRLLNSDVVVTQSITTAGLQMAVSFYGTGTITFSGTFVGSLVGTGANNKVSIVFTPTTGTLVLTVTGSVTKGQVETGNYATSYIPTLGTAVTRNGDLINKTGISDLIGQTEGVMFVESAALVSLDSVNTRTLSINDGTNSNRINIHYTTNNNSILYIVQSNGGASQFLITTAYNITNFNKIAIRYKLNDFTLWINGTKVFTIINQAMPLNLSKFSLSAGDNSNVFFAKVKQLQLYKTYLTDTEMANLTTL